MFESPMDIVKQIGKTIIFEEFDDTKPSLQTLLESAGDNPEDISIEEFFENVKRDFEIKTFKEFVDKFAPTFYQIVTPKADGSPNFSYTTEKPNFECGEVSLKNTDFMNAILNLIKDKEAGGKSNRNSNYDDFRKQLSPKAEIEKIKSIRKSIDYNMKQYFRLTEEEKLPKQNAEVQKYLKLAKQDFDSACDVYKKNPFLPMLALRIADVDNQIKLLDGNKKSEKTSDCIAIGYEPSFDDEGNVKLIEHDISNRAEIEVDGQNKCVLAITDTLSSDFDALAPASIKDNNFIKSLVVKAFSPSVPSLSVDKSLVELKKEKQKIVEIYNNYSENLINSIIPAVEKFAGIKEFFDHAADSDGNLANDVSVIISNCKADAIVNNDKALRNFQRFFVNGLGKTTTSESKIWFAVIPAVGSNEKEESSKTSSTHHRGGIFEDLETDESTEEKTKNSDLVSLNATKKMIDELSKAGIMTFFNFKATENTSFARLTKTQVEAYKKQLSSFDSEYAVFSYPNFTILPKNQNSIETDTGVYINLNDGIYLDSSYIAAGMTVGSQNYEIMKDKYGKINRNYPFVRFDFESGKNSEIFTTKMNRESEFGMDKSAKDAVFSDRFGFVFCDSRLKDIKNCYVINSRTLKKDGDNYRSIYQVLVSNFVYHLINVNCHSLTEPEIKEFQKNYSDAWAEDNLFPDRRYDNRIFMEDERLDVSSFKDGEIEFHFENDEKVQTSLKIKISRN